MASLVCSGLLAVAILLCSGCVSLDRLSSPAVTTMGPTRDRSARAGDLKFFRRRGEAGRRQDVPVHDRYGIIDHARLARPRGRLAPEGKKDPPRTMRVRGANGSEVELPTITLKEISLGDVHFDRVPALEYDFTELSVHLGLQIDGMIGFPLFRDTLCTLDYPGARLELAPLPFMAPAVRKATPRFATINFDNEQSTPLVTVQMGNESFVVLIDSGSDGSLSLNPAGLHPRFSTPRATGNLAATLGGDRPQLVGRLAENIMLGSHVIQEPVVDLTDQLSSLGGRTAPPLQTHLRPAAQSRHARPRRRTGRCRCRRDAAPASRSNVFPPIGRC